MELAFLEDNLIYPERLIQRIVRETKPAFNLSDYKNYDPKNHKVFDKSLRKDKWVMKPNGEMDKVTNKPVLTLQLELVNRIAIPLQRIIVIRSAAFLAAGPVSLVATTTTDTEKKMMLQLKKVWKDTKMNFRNTTIAQRVMSELECAEVWYSRQLPDGTYEMRSRIYSPSEGYKLFPVWGEDDDLIAFGVQWENTASGKRYFNLYTPTELRKHEQTGSGWTLIETADLPYGKLPVIYFSQKESEWSIVQGKIERLETLLSNFGDTNDYNGSPILFAEGQINGFAAKGDAGKLIEGDPGSKLSYVTWEHAPEAIKLEIETLIDFIYTCTQTPDISFKAMKGLGQAPSGTAFDKIFTDAHLKAALRQAGDYGECIQRRINFLQRACSTIDSSLKEAENLEITPQFSLFRLDDTAERIETAMKANGGQAVMAHRSSVEWLGLTENVDKEMEMIQEEADARRPVISTENKQNQPPVAA